MICHPTPTPTIRPAPLTPHHIPPQYCRPFFLGGGGGGLGGGWGADGGGGGGVGWKESRGPPFNYLDPLRKDCVHEANVHMLQPLGQQVVQPRIVGERMSQTP